MTIEQFIDKAFEGGWVPANRYPTVTEYDGDGSLIFDEIEVVIPLAAIFLDPAPWKAVGKACGWEESVWGTLNWKKGGEDNGKRHWEIERHRMIDALDRGDTIEQYLETLELPEA
jgi:hypothetical protein